MLHSPLPHTQMIPFVLKQRLASEFIAKHSFRYATKANFLSLLYVEMLFWLCRCCSQLQIFSILLPLCDLQSFSGENSTVNWSRLIEVIFYDGMFQASLSVFLEVTVTYLPPCPQMTRKYNSIPYIPGQDSCRNLKPQLCSSENSFNCRSKL